MAISRRNFYDENFMMKILWLEIFLPDCTRVLLSLIIIQGLNSQ